MRTNEQDEVPADYVEEELKRFPIVLRNAFGLLLIILFVPTLIGLWPLRSPHFTLKVHIITFIAVWVGVSAMSTPIFLKWDADHGRRFALYDWLGKKRRSKDD